MYGHISYQNLKRRLRNGLGREGRRARGMMDSPERIERILERGAGSIPAKIAADLRAYAAYLRRKQRRTP